MPASLGKQIIGAAIGTGHPAHSLRHAVPFIEPFCGGKSAGLPSGAPEFLLLFLSVIRLVQIGLLSEIIGC